MARTTANLSSPVASGGENNGATGFVFATHVVPSTSAICLGSSGDFHVDKDKRPSVRLAQSNDLSEGA